MAKKIISEPSRTLMEYRLLPGLTKITHSHENISLRTPLVYSEDDNKKYFLNIPLISAAMQSVSGSEMGIELAKLGGVAVIYCSQTIKSQAKMIRKIKNHKAGFVKPKTMKPEMKISEMYKIRKETGHSTFPVVDETGKFVGMISKWDDKNFEGFLKLPIAGYHDAKDGSNGYEVGDTYTDTDTNKDYVYFLSFG